MSRFQAVYACEYCRCPNLLNADGYCDRCQHGHHVGKQEVPRGS